MGALRDRAEEALRHVFGRLTAFFRKRGRECCVFPLWEDSPGRARPPRGEERSSQAQFPRIGRRSPARRGNKQSLSVRRCTVPSRSPCAEIPFIQRRQTLSVAAHPMRRSLLPGVFRIVVAEGIPTGAGRWKAIGPRKKTHERVFTRTGRFHSHGMSFRECRRGPRAGKNEAFVVSLRSVSDERGCAGKSVRRPAAGKSRPYAARAAEKRTVHPLPPRRRNAGKSSQALRPMLNASSMAALPVTSPFFHTPDARITPFSCTPSRQSVKPRKPSMVRSSAFLLPSAAVAMK